MFAKIASLILATAALAGAVIYAQQKADKTGKAKPVFESSKSGTPTPIEEVKPETKPGDQQQTNAENAEQKPPKKKKKKVMPTSKSYIPD